MSDELDAAIRASTHTLGAGDILAEAARREAARQSATLVRLTVAARCPTRMWTTHIDRWSSEAYKGLHP